MLIISLWRLQCFHFVGRGWGWTWQLGRTDARHAGLDTCVTGLLRDAFLHGKHNHALPWYITTYSGCIVADATKEYSQLCPCIMIISPPQDTSTYVTHAEEVLPCGCLPRAPGSTADLQSPQVCSCAECRARQPEFKAGNRPWPVKERTSTSLYTRRHCGSRILNDPAAGTHTTGSNGTHDRAKLLSHLLLL